MERTVWSDERLSERFDAIDHRFDRVDADIRELRTDLREMRTLMFQLWGSTLVGILATIVTVLART